MNYFIYTSHHFPARQNMNSINRPRSQCVASWLGGYSIAPVSRRSRVRIPLNPWFFQACSFQLLKLDNLLRWSLFTFNNTFCRINLSLDLDAENEQTVWYKATFKLRQRDHILKTKFLLWKRAKCSPSALCQWNLETQQSPVISDLCLRTPRAGKSHNYRDVIVFQNL